MGQRLKIVSLSQRGTKPIFPLAHAVWLVAFARILDRLGKGVRGAPRDALVADVTPPKQRGAAFGLRQSLDTVGATLGPLLAIFLLGMFSKQANAGGILIGLGAALVFFVVAKSPLMSYWWNVQTMSYWWDGAFTTSVTIVLGWLASFFTNR